MDSIQKRIHESIERDRAEHSVYYGQYSAWLDESLEQFNERYDGTGYGNRSYHQDNIPEDDEQYEPGDTVTIEENGKVWVHSHCGNNYIPNAVTPWAESPHFMEKTPDSQLEETA